MKGLDLRVSLADDTRVNGYALVDGHDVDASGKESIAEDDTADATLGVEVRTRRVTYEMSGTYRNYKVKVKRKQIRKRGRRKTRGERTH